MIGAYKALTSKRALRWRLQGAYKPKSSPMVLIRRLQAKELSDGAYKALTSQRALRLALTRRLQAAAGAVATGLVPSRNLAKCRDIELFYNVAKCREMSRNVATLIGAYKALTSQRALRWRLQGAYKPRPAQSRRALYHREIWRNVATLRVIVYRRKI